MLTDTHVLRMFDAGRTTWFEADKITLSRIKAKYFMEADNFLYFRKGEDWLKEFITWLGALGAGPQEILELARACGQQTLDFTQTCIDGLRQLDVKTCLQWYLMISGASELTRKHFRFIKDKIWPAFTSRVRATSRPFVRDFRILCTDSQENRDHLPKWKARGTKVRFYSEHAEAGSHRFYLNEKGYAIFWRQGKGQGTRFYGFEGTDPRIIQLLKTIFEKEWKGSLSPRGVQIV